jgi:hypothetical protein
MESTDYDDEEMALSYSLPAGLVNVGHGADFVAESYGEEKDFTCLNAAIAWVEERATDPRVHLLAWAGLRLMDTGADPEQVAAFVEAQRADIWEACSDALLRVCKEFRPHEDEADDINLN